MTRKPTGRRSSSVARAFPPRNTPTAGHSTWQRHPVRRKVKSLLPPRKAPLVPRYAHRLHLNHWALHDVMAFGGVDHIHRQPTSPQNTDDIMKSQMAIRAVFARPTQFLPIGVDHHRHNRTPCLRTKIDHKMRDTLSIGRNQRYRPRLEIQRHGLDRLDGCCTDFDNSAEKQKGEQSSTE